MKRPTLTGQLQAWIMGALILLWGAFIAIGYKTGEHEADELTDGHLAAGAALFSNLRGGIFVDDSVIKEPAGPHDLKAHDYQRSMSVVIWNFEGKLLTRSGQGPTPVFSRDEGFVTMMLGDPPTAWRTFSGWSKDKQRMVMVLLSLSERDALAQDIAGQITEPALWLLPVLALGLGFAVHRGLRPLYSLSKEIDALDVSKPKPLATQQRHEEFRASVEAINMLVSRYHASLTRERALADEFAHELRTPLTSLSLWVRALRDDPEEPQRLEVIKHLEQDVLRAGAVVTHLLALARASRAEMDEALQLIDLTDLARRTVGEFAQVAYETEHELTFVGTGLLTVKGHPVLLELALRNLIENAIHHTPAGTEVVVQVLAEEAALQVCDGPAQIKNNRPLFRSTAASHGLGFGLGHRVVQKIADIHKAKFENVTAPKRYANCYRLSFNCSGIESTNAFKN